MSDYDLINGEILTVTVTVDEETVIANINTAARGPAGTSGSGAITSATTSDGTANLYLDSIRFEATNGGPTQLGEMAWESNDGSIDAMLESGVIVAMGEDLVIRVRNTTASPITKGTALAYDGTSGASGRIEVKPWVGANIPTAKLFLGFAACDIPANSNGYSQWFGKLTEINTSGGGQTWLDEQIIYAVPGASATITNVAPTSGEYAAAAVVINAGSGTSGILFVRPTFEAASSTSATANTLVLRDGNGGASFGAVNVTALTTSGITTDGQIEFNGTDAGDSLTFNMVNYFYGAGAASAHRTALGLGISQNVTFNSVLATYNNGDNVRIETQAYIIGSGARISFRNGPWYNAEDASIVREGTGILSQRSGTTQQESRIYGTYTGPGNYRRLALKMDTAGVAQIVAEGGGSGAVGNVLQLPSNTTFADAPATRTALGLGTGDSPTFAITNASTGFYGTDARLVTTSGGVMLLGSSFYFTWGVSSPTSTKDTSLSRLSAGVLGVGTGTVGSTAGSLSLTNLTASGSITANSGLAVTSTSYPVLDVTRSTAATGDFRAATRFKRQNSSGTTSAGMGIGCFFEIPNAANNLKNVGFFGGAIATATAGVEVGELVFAPAWQGVDPYLRRDMVLRATGASTADLSLAGNLTASGTIQTGGYTFANLPSPATQGMRAYITDGADIPLYMANAAGGGSTVTPVFYNGTNWINA